MSQRVVEPVRPWTCSTCRRVKRVVATWRHVRDFGLKPLISRLSRILKPDFLRHFGIVQVFT
ncbi:hypothetical protein [Chlorogloeopsis sp. ULAP02]|uniref:hypothetical protein n=1 Tax=Chlorogloeopsis sp. ULAP02 TaxID=3107926 RepID=UPI00398AD318